MQSRSVLAAIVVAFFVVVPGCRSGADSPSNIEGQWAWTVTEFLFPGNLGSQFVTGCEVLDGILNSDQLFSITQTGNDVDITFEDSAQNTVRIQGTYDRPIFRGTMTITRGDRKIVAEFSLAAGFSQEKERMLDGSLQIVSDTDGVCTGAEADAWLMTVGEPQDVFQECGAGEGQNGIDIVIIMDTSGSMDDEAEALCEQIDNLVENLGLQNFRLFTWGITEDRDFFIQNNEPDNAEVFFCLDDNVRDRFGDPEVPGAPGDFLDDNEDWGPATAVIAELGTGGRSTRFQFRPDAVKLIIPISDEAPQDGDDNNTEDIAASNNAKTIAASRGVIVSPIIANSATPLTSQLGQEIGAATEGIAFRSTDPSLDFAQLVRDILLVACGGTLPPPPIPPDAGPIDLYAFHCEGVVSRIDPQTGDTFGLLAPRITGVGISEPVLDEIDGAVYNEATGTVWAATSDPARIYSISSTGQATFLFDNSGETGGHPDFSQRRSDRSIFGMEEDDELMFINNQTGEAVEYTDDINDFVPLAEEGNAITFVGEALYMASGEQLYSMDPFTGFPTLIDDIQLNDFPDTVTSFSVVSMTTRPSDNTVFAIIEDQTGRSLFCTIDVANASAQFIKDIGRCFDGLLWAPQGYFIGD